MSWKFVGYGYSKGNAVLCTGTSASCCVVAYAWPDADGRFDDAFFLDQDENIQQLALPKGTELSCDAARARTDWQPWRGKRPRPGPLPGTER